MDKGEVVAIPDVNKGDVVGATDAEEDAKLLTDAIAKLLQQSSDGENANDSMALVDKDEPLTLIIVQNWWTRVKLSPFLMLARVML